LGPTRFDPRILEVLSSFDPEKRRFHCNLGTTGFVFDVEIDDAVFGFFRQLKSLVSSLDPEAYRLLWSQFGMDKALEYALLRLRSDAVLAGDNVFIGRANSDPAFRDKYEKCYANYDSESFAACFLSCRLIGQYDYLMGDWALIQKAIDPASDRVCPK
jgi:hypothetical protein